MTTPNLTPPPEAEQKSAPKPNGSGPPSPPREPKLRPSLFKERGRLDAARSKLEQTIEQRDQAAEGLKQARADRVQQMAETPGSSPLDTRHAQRELEDLEALVEDRREAVALAEELVQKAEAQGPSDEQLLQLEDEIRAAIEGMQSALTDYGVSFGELQAVRARALAMLGRDSEVASWPIAPLQGIAEKVEMMVGAPSFARTLAQLDGVIRERPRRAGPPKVEQDFGLEGGKGELPPAVEVEAAPEPEPTQDEPAPQSTRPAPGEPATNKPPPTGPPKPKPGFGLAGGKTRRTD